MRIDEAPFVQRVSIPARRAYGPSGAAPFVQYVRVPREQRRIVVTNSDWRPDSRVAYHPAYLTGRVVEVRPTYVVLQPPTGPELHVYRKHDRDDRWRRWPWYRSGSYVTVPVVYQNGGYYAEQYTPQIYPQVVQWYAVPYVQLPYYNWYAPQPSYGWYNSQPTYGWYDAQPTYDWYNAQPYYNAYDQQPYYNANSTPYDNCVMGDGDDDDSYCAFAPNPGFGPGLQYGGYGNAYGYGNIAPQQLQGVVVAKTGTMLMVLAGNGFSPVFVDTTPALQNGFALNGAVAVGQVVSAFGYYNGNVFEATALE
jgi:hypothetical protein